MKRTGSTALAIGFASDADPEGCTQAYITTNAVESEAEFERLQELIEIPMKMKVDGDGRHHFILYR